MTALSRLVAERMAFREMTDRDVAKSSSRSPHGSISHGTVGNYRTGRHPVVPDERVLRVLSWTLDISLAELYRAAGLREPLGEWTPPPEAQWLSREQRDLVGKLIRMLATTAVEEEVVPPPRRDSELLEPAKGGVEHHETDLDTPTDAGQSLPPGPDDPPRLPTGPTQNS